MAVLENRPSKTLGFFHVVSPKMAFQRPGTVRCCSGAFDLIGETTSISVGVWRRSTRALHPGSHKAAHSNARFLLRPFRGALRSRARKGAEKQDSNPQARFAQPNPARSGLRALPYSLRLCCEGLEEKFLERGAPAPLSVRLEG